MGDEGLEKRVADLELINNGPPGAMGVKAKVDILWRSYVPAWTLIGTIVGWVLRSLVAG